MDSHLLRPAEWSRVGFDHDEDKVAGTYVVSENGRPEAKFYGSWDDDAPGIMLSASDGFPEIVHGNVFGKAVTLAGCRATKTRRNMSRQQDVTVRPHYAVEGMWLTEETLALTKMRVEMFDQSLWTNWAAFPAEMTAEERSGIKGFKTWYEQPETREAKIQGGVLRLRDASGHRQVLETNGWVLTSRSVFEFEFDEPVPITTILSAYLMPLEFLITSATGRRSGTSSMRGTNHTWEGVDRGDGNPRWVDVRLGHLSPESKKMAYGELLHHLDDFGFAAQLPLVFEVARRHRYPLEHYATLRRGVSAGYLADFIASVQLCEAFHRSLHAEAGDRASLAARLVELDRESGEVIRGIAREKKWHVRVARLRHIVDHGLAGAEALTEDVRSVQAATALLLLLFEVRLLVALGFDPNEAKRLAEDRATHGWIVFTIREGYEHIKEMTDRTS